MLTRACMTTLGSQYWITPPPTTTTTSITTTTKTITTKTHKNEKKTFEVIIEQKKHVWLIKVADILKFQWFVWSDGIILKTFLKKHVSIQATARSSKSNPISKWLFVRAS